MTVRYLLAFIAAFAACVALMPPIIRLARKWKVRQTVLSYVDNHSHKSGTPTMGGIAVLLALVIGTLPFIRQGASLCVLVLAVTAAFGIIGFLDDFIKVFFKQNKGLSSRQKMLFQVAVALIVSLFVFYSEFVGSVVYAPFTMRELDLGWFAPVFYMFVFLAFTNAVNLTDGLDGLAGGVTLTYTVFFGAVIALIVFYFGLSPLYTAEHGNLLIFCCALVGALLGFLLYNSFPARIFMGDTGALALGAAVAGLAVVSKLALVAPVIGIMYVVTCLSDIIQVLHYKRTKRRVFLMAPLHHHFERKGLHENSIVRIYTGITAVMGALTVLVILLIN
ncbi:MAG: phospho-N-acetylmuramoyl-pentapeptide-transferase [Clostridiales bacterium]|jgi:phospho-N-acetylmuramoyl-pentapeptide-transferase|nr:phospho-N-acetylmuramoyl-pentapeptide-transferase [Clostridiales bacterium]